MNRFAALLTFGMLTMSGCAAGPGDEPAAEPPPETADQTQTEAEAPEPSETPAIDEPSPRSTDTGELNVQTLVGVLGGSAELEGGCAWLETPQGRFEVIYPQGYRVEFDPLRLLGPEGATVAEEGDEIAVTGAPAGDLMSICQVGAIFEATEVEAGDS
ncbi:MAG TPA: hypothetical protein VML96_03275 [Egibacteraceae bacterium]|nr:hypothetical protein [Egibacteraceae bacterium]